MLSNADSKFKTLKRKDCIRSSTPKKQSEPGIVDSETVISASMMKLNTSYSRLDKRWVE
jgi:hypothetical protein